MFHHIKAVLFDLDGTLVDSMWMWKDIDIEYLHRFGIELPENLHANIEGMSFTETASYFKSRFQLRDSVETIMEDWHEMVWEKYAKQVPLKEGVVTFLKQLKQNGMRIGIGTSNSKALVELVLERHGILSYFDSIRTSCEVGKGKPSPDIYYLVAKDLKIEPQYCLVFEDVVQGIMAGKNAGMKVCAVYDEYSKKDDKKKRELADYYIESYKSIV